MKKIMIICLVGVMAVLSGACSTVTRNGNGNISVRTLDPGLAREVADDNNDYTVSRRTQEVIDAHPDAVIQTPGITYVPTVVNGNTVDPLQHGIFVNSTRYTLTVRVINKMTRREMSSFQVRGFKDHELALLPGFYILEISGNGDTISVEREIDPIRGNVHHEGNTYDFRIVMNRR